MNIFQHTSQPPVDLGQDIVVPPPNVSEAVSPPGTVPPPGMIVPEMMVPAVTADGSLPGGQADLAAAVFLQRTRRRSQARLQRGLPKVLRRRRVIRRHALAVLLAEDHHVGASRDPARATHAETVVRAAGKAGADGHLVRSQRRLDRVARRIDRQRARQARLLIRAGHRQHDLARHPDGGQETVADLRRYQAAQRAQIEDEKARGSRKHQRLPRWIGHVPRLVLLVDFCLLLYFFAGITDVDWGSPLSAPLAFAALLAAMVTLLSYGFLAFSGYRLRGHKDHSGAIATGDLDGLTRTACAAAIFGMAVIAALMFIRMRTEVLYALGPQGWVTALVIALVLAVVSLLANFLVMAIHALDGSDEVARLEVLSAATSGPLSKAHRMQEKAALIPYRIAVRQRRAARAAMRAVTEAGRHLAAADQTIEAAQVIHQGTGPHSSPASDPNGHDRVVGYRDQEAAPEVDFRPLRLTLEHIDTALPEVTPGQPR
jgi:hypothetical protein